MNVKNQLVSKKKIVVYTLKNDSPKTLTHSHRKKSLLHTQKSSTRMPHRSRRGQMALAAARGGKWKVPHNESGRLTEASARSDEEQELL